MVEQIGPDVLGLEWLSMTFQLETSMATGILEGDPPMFESFFGS